MSGSYPAITLKQLGEAPADYCDPELRNKQVWKMKEGTNISQITMKYMRKVWMLTCKPRPGRPSQLKGRRSRALIRDATKRPMVTLDQPGNLFTRQPLVVQCNAWNKEFTLSGINHRTRHL